MQTSEHDSELGRWQVAQRAAHPGLRTFVHGFFASSSELPKPVFERHLPSTEVALLLNFGTPHRRSAGKENGRWADHDGAFVVALQDGPLRSEAFGERHFMVVRFTPVGAHLLFGLPMHELASGAISLADIDPAFARRILGSVGAAKGWDERFNVMEAVVAGCLERKTIPGAIALAWQRMASADGRIAVGRLASELEYGHHRLTREFQACIGLPPKTVARLFRFNRAVRLLNRRVRNRPDKIAGKPYLESSAPHGAPAAQIAWADLAAACGYFDQPHFIRDFQRFAGLTPTAFLRTLSDVD